MHRSQARAQRLIWNVIHGRNIPSVVVAITPCNKALSSAGAYPGAIEASIAEQMHRVAT